MKHQMNNEKIIRPLASWQGMDRLVDEIVPSTTIILTSGGCSWNRCRMCQYRHERFQGADHDNLDYLMQQQLSYLQNNLDYEETPLIKLYTSGSFFDPAEVPQTIHDAVASQFRGKCMIIESRIDYTDIDLINRFVTELDDGSHKTPLYIALGIETSSDAIREKCIDKGVTFDEFVKTADKLHDNGVGVKSYLLHKPAYLTEKEAFDDMIHSIEDIAPYSDMISMNPCTVQRNTHVERLYKAGQYRPPYLWSVVSILLTAKPHLSCDPMGGGQARGPHNCGTCDTILTDGIRDYALTADRELLRSLMSYQCDCHEEWEFVMENERPYNMPLTS